MNLTFQRRTALALAALRRLSNVGVRVPGPELARSISTTRSFLPQVMAPLIRSGWVSSERGPGGGYQLSGEASRLTVLDVIEAMEPPSQHARCALGDGSCPVEYICAVDLVWRQARDVLVDGLGRLPAVPERGRLDSGAGI